MTDGAGTSALDEQLINQFKEICAVDGDVARYCLEQSDGDLQNAVIRFLSGNLNLAEAQYGMNGVEVRRRNRATVYDSSSTGTSFSDDDSLAAERLPPRQDQVATTSSWFAWITDMVTSPVAFFYNTFYRACVFVFGFVSTLWPAITSPEEDSLTFRSEMEIKYADVESKLPWRHVTYTEVLRQSKEEVRFVLVYLHNPAHQATETFIRGTLCSAEFFDFVERNNIIVWGTNVRTTEGHKVAQALREYTYPALALICMRENRHACVQRVVGSMPKTELIQLFQNGVERNQRFISAILNERAQREMNTRLRREQEEEYQRALEQDRKNLAERRRKESELADAQRREEEEQRKLEEKRQRFIEHRQKVRDELTGFVEPTADFVRVSVRFPCGARFDRKFGVDESLEILFKVVFGHERCPEDFSLISSYPRKEIACAPEWYHEYGTVSDEAKVAAIKTFKESGLVGSLVILVRDNLA